MKTTVFFAGLFAATAIDAAVIEQVIVRQQWPWSTDVKVEYRITGVTSPVDIGVRAFNGDQELDSANLAASITGDRYGIASDGVGAFVIDPVKAFGTPSVALANFKVRLSLSASAANVNEVIYKVFDLTTGACTDIKRSDFYNGKVEDGDYVTDYTSLDSRLLAPSSEMVGDVLIWTGVTNNVKYKTTHLVMRKIPAANKIWTMGSSVAERTDGEGKDRFPGWETNHHVKLTRSYYMGVFEVTQKQYTLLVGNNPSPDKTREDADVLPVNKLYLGAESGNNNNTAWEAVKRMRTKTANSNFCLPTEAQWEFACRAGSLTGLYSGRNVSPGGFWSGADGQLNPLAWFNGNSAVNGSKIQHPVARKLPNAFGLYDMLGNVLEWTLDVSSSGTDYVDSFGVDWQPGVVVVDPTGPTTGSAFVFRGGSFSKDAAYCRVTCRSLSLGRWDTPSNDNGMRMALMEE